MAKIIIIEYLAIIFSQIYHADGLYEHSYYQAGHMKNIMIVG